MWLSATSHVIAVNNIGINCLIYVALLESIMDTLPTKRLVNKREVSMIAITAITFLARSLKNISPLLKLIIAELSTFIHDKKDRLIFTEITSGAKIEDVAKRCGISYDGICRRYKAISLRLQENMGFLTEYKKTITNQDLEIERLWIENRNMEYELRRLYKKALQNGLYIESPRSLTSVPLNAAKRICQPITRLTLAPYIRKCLTTLKIETIEDILRYALKNGLDSLLDFPDVLW